MTKSVRELTQSSNECRTVQTVDPQTKPTELSCESACMLLSSTPTIAIQYYTNIAPVSADLQFAINFHGICEAQTLGNSWNV